MKIKCTENLTIYYLDDSEYDNAKLKNDCLRKAATDYVAFAADGRIREDKLLQIYWENIERKDKLVAAFFRGVQISKTDYSGAFELVSLPIEALLFYKGLTRKAGAYNEKLIARTDFELLCRLTEYTDECILSDIIQENEQNEPAEAGGEWAYTSAYMIRRHLGGLHKLGLTDQVFRLFCTYMMSIDRFSVFRQYVNMFLSDEKAYERVARQTAPFAVIRGDGTCGGVLRRFADDLSEELEECGQAVIRLDEHFDEYKKLQSTVCKGIVGFQAPALESDFFKKIHGAKFQFLFDNPLHFGELLRNLPNDYYILCQDADYADSVRKYYHTEHAIQFPPAGIARDMRSGQRPYDIVFIGSYFEDCGDSLEGDNRIFYDYMLCHPEITFEQGIREVFYRESDQMQTDSDGDSFVRKAFELKTACRMVIGHFRNAVVTAILEAGFELHVYGEAWDCYPFKEGYRLVIHPQVTVDESLEELGKAKIGLNIMSWHKAGMTERIANIMLSGAVCLTEETSYLREHMTDGENIRFFNLTQLERLPDVIRGLLREDKVREKIAENAYRKAMTEHTWHIRAEQLIDLAENADETTRF